MEGSFSKRKRERERKGGKEERGDRGDGEAGDIYNNSLADRHLIDPTNSPHTFYHPQSIVYTVYRRTDRPDHRH